MAKFTKLKEHRMRLGFSQVEVAKRAYISQVYYCRIENGKSIPSKEVAESIINVLGVPMEWLRPQTPTL